MDKKILVAYATRSGSTGEVAEKVGEVIRQKGLLADVRPAGEIRSLEGYGAVVLGAPLYMFRLHKDARKFLRRNKAALLALPAAVFALGPISNEEKEWKDVHDNLIREIGNFPWFDPEAVELFGGVLKHDKLTFPFNLPAVKMMPEADCRDWQKIAEWAAGLADKFAAIL